MKSRNYLSILALLLLSTQSAIAANISFTGNFSQDSDVSFFTFSIAAPSTVTLKTLSFSGGTNAAGDSIASGGFQTAIHLWTAAGIDAGGDAAANGDALYSLALTAGSYIVALTENNNLALGDLPGGALDASQFSQFGNGNFTGPEYNFAPGSFIDQNGDSRSNAWALDMLSVDSAQAAGTIPVPEAGVLGMTLAGLAAFSLFTRRRQTFIY